MTLDGRRFHQCAAHERVREYRASGDACRACPAFGACTTSPRGLMVVMGPWEQTLVRHREWMAEAQTAFRRRCALVEPTFGIVKEQLEEPSVRTARTHLTQGGLRNWRGERPVPTPVRYLLPVLSAGAEGFENLVEQGVDGRANELDRASAWIRGGRAPWRRSHAYGSRRKERSATTPKWSERFLFSSRLLITSSRSTARSSLSAIWSMLLRPRTAISGVPRRTLAAGEQPRHHDGVSTGSSDLQYDTRRDERRSVTHEIAGGHSRSQREGDCPVLACSWGSSFCGHLGGTLLQSPRVGIFAVTGCCILELSQPRAIPSDGFHELPQSLSERTREDGQRGET